tara:strand:+ start:2590 stop:3237 length:648 start_codon:yes stop_codon:yes gene_type:complete
MAIKRTGEVSKKNDLDPIPNLEAGEHEGRLRYVADLGLHTNEYKGEVKPNVQKLALGIEIVGETIEIDGETKPRLLWTSAFNIFHQMTEKGKELQFYKVFDTSATEGVIADWDAVIDEPCNVTVVHVQGKGENSDRTYDNISSISPIPSKYKAAVAEGLVTDGCTGDVEDENNPAQAATFGLPAWFITNRISVKPMKEAPVEPEKEEMFDDDVPF